MRKILAFIVNCKHNKFLALFSEPHLMHGKGGWFVVTGGVEDSETYEDAVCREVREETGIIVKDIMSLNWGSIYNNRNCDFEEHNYMCFVNSQKISLNEEHSEYEWLSVDDFINRINWLDDKNLLEKVLIEALNKKQFYTKEKIIDYR